MNRLPQVVCVLTLISAATLSGSHQTQDQDPHLPKAQTFNLSDFVQYDDLLLTPDQHAALTTPAPEVSRNLPARSAGFSQIGAFDIVVASITRTDEWRLKNPGRTPLNPAGFRPAVSLNRDEFLDVLNRLDRFYSAPEGLQRPNGLSIAGGPDFLGIATWIFDIYLTERLNGISPNGAWTITENAIRATNEWRSKH